MPSMAPDSALLAISCLGLCSMRTLLPKQVGGALGVASDASNPAMPEAADHLRQPGLPSKAYQFVSRSGVAVIL
jgi:hypothetical protein